MSAASVSAASVAAGSVSPDEAAPASPRSSGAASPELDCSSRRSTPARSWATISSELAPDVAEHVAQVEPFAQLLASPAQTVHEVLEPGQVRPGRVAAAPAAFHQPAQGLGQVALGHDVVRQRVEDLVRRQIGELLAAVPARVAGVPREDVVAVTDRRDAAAEIARIGRIGGHRW